MSTTRPWGQMPGFKSQCDPIMGGLGQVTWDQPNGDQLPCWEKKKKSTYLAWFFHELEKGNVDHLAQGPAYGRNEIEKW